MYGQRQPSYAPIPPSATPIYSLSAKINLDEEVKLSTSSAERDLYDSLAEIYSIIVTLDALERASLKDSISESDYTETCSRLLKQYKSNLADNNVSNAFVDLETFKRQWNLECPKATERIRIGLPSTIEQAGHRSGPAGGGAGATLIIAAGETFITLLDAIKIGMLSKDSLHPLLGEVIQSVNKVTPGEFDGRAKIVNWLIALNRMRASQELDEDQARQFASDMDEAYRGFKATLE